MSTCYFRHFHHLLSCLLFEEHTIGHPFVDRNPQTFTTSSHLSLLCSSQHDENPLYNVTHHKTVTTGRRHGTDLFVKQHDRFNRCNTRPEPSETAKHCVVAVANTGERWESKCQGNHSDKWICFRHVLSPWRGKREVERGEEREEESGVWASGPAGIRGTERSEEHTSELQSQR